MHWNIVWSQSLTSDIFGGVLAPKGKTVSFPVVCQQSGNKIRIRLCNERGKKPYLIESISIIKNENSFPVTVEGKRNITVPVHTKMYTDETVLPVERGDKLQIRICLKSGAMDLNNSENETVCRKGNVTDQVNAFSSAKADMAIQAPYVPVIDRVELLGETETKVILAFGDSITAMGFWTKPLAERICQEYGDKYVLLNAGIAGNCMTCEWEGSSFKYKLLSKMMGQKGADRFERDVLSFENLHAVIFALGINDISNMCSPKQPWITVEHLEEETRKLAGIVREKGARVVLHTLTPFEGSETYTKEREKERQKFNQWIRTAGAEFSDDIMDCEALLADESNPMRIREEFDRGDHLHPNREGGRVIAENYDLKKLTGENR